MRGRISESGPQRVLLDHRASSVSDGQLTPLDPTQGAPRNPDEEQVLRSQVPDLDKANPRYGHRWMTTIFRRDEGWSDLIKRSSVGVAHLGPTHATGCGRPVAAGRYVRAHSRSARLPR